MVQIIFRNIVCPDRFDRICMRKLALYGKPSELWRVCMHACSLFMLPHLVGSIHYVVRHPRTAVSTLPPQNVGRERERDSIDILVL